MEISSDIPTHNHNEPNSKMQTQLNINAMLYGLLKGRPGHLHHFRRSGNGVINDSLLFRAEIGRLTVRARNFMRLK